jgi:hypothetical protein
MLTTGQCQVAAYLTDGDVICTDCAEHRINFNEEDRYDELVDEEPGDEVPSWHRARELRKQAEAERREREEAEGLRPLIQYELDSDECWQEDGLTCGDCGAILVEPYEDPDAELTDEAADMDAWLADEQKGTE